MEHEKSTESPADFADWFRARLAGLGYDLAVRGEQARFVKDHGLSQATVSRILDGRGVSDVRVLARLATALGVSLDELIRRARILTPDELAALARRDPDHPPITPEQAADELGITNPRNRRAFRAMIDAMRKH